MTEVPGLTASEMYSEYIRRTGTSRQLSEEAESYLPGGDSRSTLYFHPYPLFFARGEGYWLYDADGNSYLDFTGNHTSLILGYGNPHVQQALAEQIAQGTSFPGPTRWQVLAARLICHRTPSIERVRFVNSGTEATMNAIRAARAFTKRNMVVKVEGAFHGTHDVVEVSIAPDPAQSGPAERPRPVPHVQGIPDETLNHVAVIPFNDSEAAVQIIEGHADQVACVIVEPVMGSAGMLPARKDYLVALREATSRVGALLVFDEVITYRLASGGAQEWYDVHSDLTCLGKMIGGGLPLGAFGGRADVMALFDPSQGPSAIHHGGSLNANPLSLVSALATLEQLTPGSYRKLSYLGERLRRGVKDVVAELNAPVQVTGAGSLFGIHFNREPVCDYRSAQKGDSNLRHQLFLGMLNRGVVMDARGAGCISLPTDEEAVDTFVSTVEDVLKGMP